MKKIILVTGGFDPLHSGHIAYFESAKKLGDILVVGVNSDNWLAHKKGRSFMPLSERIAIIRSLGCVDFVVDFDDSDGTAKNAITIVQQSYPHDQIIFANGGDRTSTNIPEMDMTGVTFEFGVGGENKANSSSWILEEWKAPKTERPWGYYRVLHDPSKQIKVKELTVNPGKQLSMQRHQHRAEHWFISEGSATVYTMNQQGDKELLGFFTQFQHTHIDCTQWHQLCNESDSPLKVVEIQYGTCCEEEDIERQ
jgi:cytidyltransferase-like protein